MKLPWVSRAQYAEKELAVVNLRGILDAHYQAGGDNLIRAKAAEERTKRAESLHDDLLTKYHALKLQGAVVVEPPPVPVIAARAPVDPVRQKIRDQARANPTLSGLGAYLTDYARELRDEHNMTSAEIVEMLGKWESSEEQSAAVDSYVETIAVTDDEAVA